MSIILDWKFVTALGFVLFVLTTDDETKCRVLVHGTDALKDYAIAISNR